MCKFTYFICRVSRKNRSLKLLFETWGYGNITYICHFDIQRITNHVIIWTPFNSSFNAKSYWPWQSRVCMWCQIHPSSIPGGLCYILMCTEVYLTSVWIYLIVLCKCFIHLLWMSKTFVVCVITVDIPLPRVTYIIKREGFVCLCAIHGVFLCI